MALLIHPDSVTTQRCIIRRYRLGDGPELARATTASYAHLAPWMPWAQPRQSVEEAVVLVRQFVGRWMLAQDFVLGIWSADEATLWGGCGFHLRHGPVEDGVAEMGMWITAEQAGQGLGTHALQTLVDWGFSEWPWLRLVWKCDERNLASRRVAEKAGLQLEGITRSDSIAVDGGRRDTAWYAIVRS